MYNAADNNNVKRISDSMQHLLVVLDHWLY
jgi:hypothetical protein